MCTTNFVPNGMINADVNQTANHTRRRHRLLHLLSPPPLNLWHTPVAWAFGLPRALRVSALQHDHQHTGRRKQVPRQFPLCRSPRQSSQPATQATARSTHVADCRNRGESTTVGSVLCSGGGEFLPSAPPPTRASRPQREGPVRPTSGICLGVYAVGDASAGKASRTYTHCTDDMAAT